MNFDEARELAKQTPGSTVARNDMGSFHVRLTSGEVIDKEDQGTISALEEKDKKIFSIRTELTELKSKEKLLFNENSRYKDQIDYFNKELEKKENKLTELITEVKFLRESEGALKIKVENLLSEICDLEDLISKINPETIAEIKKEKFQNETLKTLEGGLYKITLDELMQIKETAISFGLPQSTVDEIQQKINLKKNSQLSNSATIVGSSIIPVETVSPYFLSKRF